MQITDINTKDQPPIPSATSASHGPLSDSQLESLAREVAEMFRSELATTAASGGGRVNMLIYEYTRNGLRRWRLVEENIARQYGTDWASNIDAKNALGEDMRFFSAASPRSVPQAIIVAAAADITDANTGAISDGFLVLAQTRERMCIYTEPVAGPPSIEFRDKEEVKQAALKMYGVEPSDTVLWFRRPLTRAEENQMKEGYVEIPNPLTADRIFVNRNADRDQVSARFRLLRELVAGRSTVTRPGR